MKEGDFPALARVHNGFPLAFFDGPGGTQVPQAVIDAVTSYYHTCNSNTQGFFVTTNETDKIIEDTRERVGEFLGADSGRLISFGHNMTSLNFRLAEDRRDVYRAKS